jgi:hypothetical protein
MVTAPLSLFSKFSIDLGVMTPVIIVMMSFLFIKGFTCTVFEFGSNVAFFASGDGECLSLMFFGLVGD